MPLQDQPMVQTTPRQQRFQEGLELTISKSHLVEFVQESHYI
jgi:hypothetical protein